MDANSSNIVIDELNQVRLVNPGNIFNRILGIIEVTLALDLTEDAQQLNTETSSFVNKLTRFDELVESIAGMLAEVCEALFKKL